MTLYVLIISIAFIAAIICTISITIYPLLQRFRTPSLPPPGGQPGPSTTSSINIKLNINDHVDCVYIIALPQRRAYVDSFLKTHSIQATIVNALTVDTVDINWLHNIADYATTVSLPRVMCHASHIATLETFLQSRHQTCLIFEDDVVVTTTRLSRFNWEFSSIMSTLPSSFDILYLGYCWDHCNKRTPIANSSLLVKPFVPKCRHAYIVSRKGAETIIRHSTPLHSLPGDIIIGLMVKNNILDGYAVRYPLFTQNRKELGTTLGNYDSIRPCW